MTDKQETSLPPLAKPPLTAPAFDPDDYHQDLADFHLTAAQEKELLEALWHIMAMFVDLGWGLDSLPIVLPDIFGANARNPETTKNRKDTP